MDRRTGARDRCVKLSVLKLDGSTADAETHTCVARPWRISSIVGNWLDRRGRVCRGGAPRFNKLSRLTPAKRDKSRGCHANRRPDPAPKHTRSPSPRLPIDRRNDRSWREATVQPSTAFWRIAVGRRTRRSERVRPFRPIAVRVASAFKRREIHECVRERFVVRIPLAPRLHQPTQ